MSVSIPASLARHVVARAYDTCEYCKLRQSSQEATFHIDHIHPRVDGGETVEGNLAFGLRLLFAEKIVNSCTRSEIQKLQSPLSSCAKIYGRTTFAGRETGAS